jgi:hypothetical protein
MESESDTNHIAKRIQLWMKRTKPQYISMYKVRVASYVWILYSCAPYVLVLLIVLYVLYVKLSTENSSNSCCEVA